VSLASDLRNLGSNSAYPPRGRPLRRWGQILREPPEIAAVLDAKRREGMMSSLADIAGVHSGVVTRANAYFVVRDVPYEEIPSRFQITKRDHKNVRVVEDGLKSLHRIEVSCLRPVLKGPESLRGPTEVADGDQLVFSVGNRTKDQLRDERAKGALAYLKRGETVDYAVSEDRLKGGIPAQRSQVKNRRPFWYSLPTDTMDRMRIVVPEHFDSRFLATLLPADSRQVVLDTLYSIIPHSSQQANLIHLSLNSALTWYQLEQRGRTQHGEGVLKVKVADWESVLVLNPADIDETRARKLEEAFEPLKSLQTTSVVEELVKPERVAFDLQYLEALGITNAKEFRLTVERELRAAISERKERARSVDAAKATKTAIKRVTASVDAFASRIASSLEPFPDPRTFAEDESGATVLVSTPIEGTLELGEDLLSQGEVLAGGQVVAFAGDLRAAEYVRGVLLHDPELSVVQLPDLGHLQAALSRWEEAVIEWQGRFDEATDKALNAIADVRLRAEIRQRALVLLHAV
jgi:hypothetical protein